MTRRTLTLGVALAGATLVCSGGPALGGGFDDETILRTPPAGTRLEASDIEAKGNDVVVGWQEMPIGGSRTVSVRTSDDGGATWFPRMRARSGLDQQREIGVDTCEGWAWAVSGLHTAGAPAAQWRVVLDGHQIGSPGFFQIQPAHLQRHQPRAGHRLCGQQAAGGRVAPEGGRRLPRQGLYAGRDLHPKETTRPSCRSTSARRPCPRGSVSPRPRTASISPGSGATMRGTSASTSAPGRTSQ